VTEPNWVRRETVLVLHEQSLVQFGGTAGIRDEGLFDSALGRPQNLFAYGKPTISELAASYAFGLARNHPFLDGNKRTAFITAVLFLEINGQNFEAEQADAAVQTLGLAAGEVSEAEYAAWLRKNCKKS
jgi:death-on-curing protein